MKKLTQPILLLLLFSFNCKAQTINTEFKPEGKTPYLVGRFTKSALQSKNYSTWFTPNFEQYKPDSTIVSILKADLKDYDIKLFMATWCGDSKRQVPKFFKILEKAKYPNKQLTAIAVSKEKETYKESPQHEESGLNIVRVPTIIFFKDGKEINRIIEKPIETLEKDMLKIVNNNDYKPHYFGIKRSSDKSKNN